jgi:pSer/pThr/pTyr-binding forkhead associated (FHA) protein
MRRPRWVLASADPTLTIRLPPNTIKTLGRAASADFILDAALVSRLHCKLIADNADQLFVEDLGSTNGVLVNGRREARCRLSPGDVLTVGRVTLTVARA